MVNVINAVNIKDNNVKAPLLPPDEITIAGSMFNIIDPVIGRAWYKDQVKKDYNSSKTKRGYLIGSYYSSLYNHSLSNIIDWNDKNDINISVMMNSTDYSVIKVRKCPDILSESILELHNRLKRESPNSCRHKYGDKGKMFALGKKDITNEYAICNNNPDICMLIEKISTIRKRWYIESFPEDYKSNFNIPIDINYMKFGLSDLMVHSMGLCNASHYDVFDDSITVSTWIEEEINVTDNWYLVFPNVTCDGKKAIVIKLFHGCTISWNAGLLRHASSKVSYRLRGGGRSAGNCELRRKNRYK